MRILGIDPGTVVTGIGVIDCTEDKITLLNLDSLNFSTRQPLHTRLKKIYDGCIKKIEIYKPEVLAIETAFYGKNIQSTLKLGQARGVAIIAGLNSNLEVFEYSPREVKQSVTGKGAAAKSEVLFMIKNILGIKENPEYIDSSDAAAVALCHYYKTHGMPQGLVKSKSRGKSTDWKKFIEDNPHLIAN